MAGTQSRGKASVVTTESTTTPFLAPVLVHKPNVLNLFTVILRLAVIFIAILHFLYGVYLTMVWLIYKSKVEGLIRLGFYTCEQVIEEGEGTFAVFYMLVHGTLSLVLLDVVTPHTSQFIIFWILSLFVVTVFMTFAQVHILTSFPGFYIVQKPVVLQAIILLALSAISMLIVLLYFFHLNNYDFITRRAKTYRSGRILNREILAKRMDRFNLVNTAMLWGGKVQAIELIRKLETHNKSVLTPDDDDLEFDEDEALYSFDQVHGLPHLRVYRTIHDEEHLNPHPHLQKEKYLRDEYRYNARPCPPLHYFCSCRDKESKTKVHPKKDKGSVAVPPPTVAMTKSDDLTELVADDSQVFPVESRNPVGSTINMDDQPTKTRSVRIDIEDKKEK